MKLFYAECNSKVYWHELAQHLNDLEFYPKYIYSNDFFEIFKYIVLNILNQNEVILLDGNFTATELRIFTGKSVDEIRAEKVANRLKGKIGGVEGLRQKIKENQNAEFVLYTSGTTGRPKAVRHPLRNLRRSVIVSEEKENDIWGFAYHPTHIAGLQVFLQALYNGNTLVRLFGLSKQEIEKQIADCRVTNISATPTFLRLISMTSLTFPSVHRVTSGGEKFDSALLERMKNIFPNAKFRNIYASTEFGTLLISSGEIFEVKDASKVKILDGELFVHKSLLGQFISDYGGKSIHEWYATGDLVEKVGDHPLRLKFVGRKNSMINVGGLKVNPTEVEELISKLFEVEYVKVYGKKNSVVGSLVCCDIIANDPSLDEQKIREKLNEFLQPHKVPRLIRFIKQADLTRTGKTKRQV